MKIYIKYMMKIFLKVFILISIHTIFKIFIKIFGAGRRSKLTNRILIFFFLFLANEPSYSMNWVNMAGLDKKGQYEKVLLWTSLNDPQFEAGIFRYGLLESASGGSIGQIYGGINYAAENIQWQAGHIFKSVFNEFIVSHGEFIPGENSTPDRQPLGFTIRLTQSILNFSSGSYFQFWVNGFNAADAGVAQIQKIQKISQDPVQNRIHIDSISLKFQLKSWVIEPVGIVSTTRSLTPDPLLKEKNLTNALDGSFYLNVYYLEYFKAQALYSYRYGSLGIINLMMKDFFLDLYLMNAKAENPFAALLYNVNRHYYFSLRNSLLKVKIYDEEKTVHSAVSIKINNFGFYNYLSGKNILSGIFYCVENGGISPYLAFYSTVQTDVIQGSIGINFQKDWMFAIFHSVNKSRKYFPFDEQIIPGRFYYSGVNLDSQTGYDHSYFGFQFYWNSKPLFFYASIFQNYDEKQDDNITVTLRLEYSKEF